MRDFYEWLKTFRNSICDYKYYVNFDKVYLNAEKFKVELNMMNSLIGSQNIERDFERLVKRYPEVLCCVPILLAKREYEIFAQDEQGACLYDFRNADLSIDEYSYFMTKTGLFDLISNHLVNNLLDYVVGVEVGLDSNGRKNRGGHLMEDLVESFLVKCGLKKNQDYFKEMYIHEITSRWGIDLSAISNQGKMEKRFDFVVKTKSSIYGIETNFYTGGGSKLNETARSYKTLANEADKIDGFTFVWITDGCGWRDAARNLEETFDVLDTLYCIQDLENGILVELFKDRDASSEIKPIRYQLEFDDGLLMVADHIDE